jgi:hypothetical protein
MDFDALLGVDDGPNLFEPPDLSVPSSLNLQASLYNKPPSPTPLLPQPPPPPIRPGDKRPVPPKQTHHTVGARMQALTLFEHGGKDENGDKL